MEQKQPKVSVVIPAYHAENYIRQAIQSVLEQTYPELIEILIVDDASADHTESVVKEVAPAAEEGVYLRKNRFLQYFKNTENKGVAFTRNFGVSQAKGDYVAFLDADDWWAESKLRLQYEYLVKRCDKIALAQEKAELVGKKMKVRYPVLCCTARELTDAEGNTLKKIIAVPETITYQMNLKTNYIPCSSVLIKRTVAQEFPMYRDDMHEDYITWLKVLKKYGPAVGLNQPLLYYRVTPGSKSRNKLKSARMQYRCYRYMKIGPFKAVWYLMNYMAEGMNKYKDVL